MKVGEEGILVKKILIICLEEVCNVVVHLEFHNGIVSIY